MSDAADPEVALTGLVICHNEVGRIGACLASLGFCDEILVLDSGSTDGTQAICAQAGARVVHRPFLNFADQKDAGRAMARGRWVLVIDADEVVSALLQQEVRAIADRGGEPGVDAYRMPFRNHFRDTWVRRAGYYPDPHVRLLRRDRAHFDPATPVHEKVRVQGTIGDLRGHVDHHSFVSLDHFLAKSSRYADRTCKSLARELDEVQDALRAQSAKLNDKATQDAVVTGVGVILFWPVLFALGNNAGLEGDVARLKGEEQAIRKQMREADCDPPPKSSAPAAAEAVPVPVSGEGAKAAAPR